MLFSLRRLSLPLSVDASPQLGHAGSREHPEGVTDDDEFLAGAIGLLQALYGMALRLTRDGDDAQDLVQETYLKALRARARFAAGTNLKAWLFTILQNTWRNRRREQARARVAFDSSVVDDAADNAAHGASAPEDPESLLLRATFDAELKAALDALPDAYREAVWLRDVEELSYQEIADVLAIPIGTVMSRIARGRRQLHRLLVAVHGTPELMAGRTHP